MNNGTSRVFVKDRDRLVPLLVHEIQRVEAHDDYVVVHARDRRFLVHQPLARMEERLNGGAFVRVHRRHVVNLAHVASLIPHTNSQFEVEMQDGSRVTASRKGSKLLRGLAL